MGRPPPSKSPAKKRPRAEPAPAVAQPPAEITSFIGRADDLHAIAQRFEHSARLLTVIGPGGVGKTRLARRFVAAHAAAFQRGGVSFCELAEARTLDDILRIVGAALSVPPPRGGTSLEHSGQLARALAQRGRALVVLDNFEHIVALAPDTVGAWLRLAPHTCFLVTSREALGIEGEARHELAPLDEADALVLFQDRARARVAAFRLDDATRPAAIEIVRRLDHLPLAIELAATRVGVLTPREIGERLSERFKLLRSDRRDVTARQATLRAAIDWSWRLLAPDEQRALAQVAVFRGGFSPAAAEAVIDLGADGAWPLDVLHALHQKSLLVAGPAPGAPEETRFEVLESIREFASGELDRSGERARAELRHATYWARAAEEGALRARGPEASASFAWFDRELENLLAAHRAAASVEPSLAARIALALEIFFTARGLQELVREVHASMIACAEESGDRRLLARALVMQARVTRNKGRLTEARVAVERARELARELGATSIEADALRELGLTLGGLGSGDEGEALIARSLAMRVEPDTCAEGDGWLALGSLCFVRGRPEGALAPWRRAIAIYRAAGDVRREAILLGNLAALASDRGDLAEGRALFCRAIELSRELGDRRAELIHQLNFPRSSPAPGRAARNIGN